MVSMRAARLAGAAVAGLGLAAAGLAGAASPAQAGPRAGGAPLSPVRGGTISTIEGGVGGPGPATSVAISPCGVDPAGGWLYIGDGSTVRRVSTATGALSTVAGDNAAGPANNSGTAVSSAFFSACGTALDRAGNLVIADSSQVQVVAARTGTFYGQHMTAGHIYTVAGRAAGSGYSARAGDGGPAAKATLSSAADVAFDQAGNLVIADSGQQSDCNYGCLPPVGSLVRVVAVRTGTFYGQKMTAGDIYTVAGVASVGPVGDGGLATRAWLGPGIGTVRPDRAGNLVVADSGENDTFAVIAPSVQVIAAGTGTFYGIQMTAGHIYQVAGNGQTGSGDNGGGDGGPATAASLEQPGSAVPDNAGNLVIGDGNRVRVVAAGTGHFYGQQMTAGYIYGIAGTAQAGYSGDGGPAVRAQVSSGTVGVDAAGNVLLADGNRVRLIAARTGTLYGEKMTAGDIYAVAGNGTIFSGDGGPPLRAELSDPAGVAVDAAGDIAFTAVVEGVNTTVDLIPARSRWLFGMRLTVGRVYILTGQDEGPTRNERFCIGGASPVAFDHGGNLLLADGCDNLVRVIVARSGRFYRANLTAGGVYPIAGTGAWGFSGDGGSALKARLDDPSAVAVDHHGNVLIADPGNHRVRVIAAATGTFYGQKMTVGDIYTIAGDGSASFSGDGGPAVKTATTPLAVGIDATGNVLIADANDRVRVVAVADGTMYGQRMTAGHIYTIAGDGGYGSSGSGGPASKAAFQILGGMTTDRHGNVVFTDWSKGVVWVLPVKNGTFYGQRMTVGRIYVVAGGGATLGDGGPAAKALLSFPFAVAVAPTGGLLVSDGNDNRLRAISP